MRRNALRYSAGWHHQMAGSSRLTTTRQRLMKRSEIPNLSPGPERPDMTDKAAEKLKSSGWTIVDTTGFLSLVGPLWQRLVDNEHEYALITQDKHHNRRGLVQGGLLMTFADRTCGMTARFVSGRPTLATLQPHPPFVHTRQHR